MEAAESNWKDDSLISRKYFFNQQISKHFLNAGKSEDIWGQVNPGVSACFQSCIPDLS